MAFLYEKQEDHFNAVRVAREINSLYPKDLDVHSFLATNLEIMGDYEQAQEHSEIVSRLKDPLDLPFTKVDKQLIGYAADHGFIG